MAKELKKIFEQPTFASKGGLKDFNDEQRAKGWESIGKEPPESTQFNVLQNDAERAIKYLYAQMRDAIRASFPGYDPDETKSTELHDVIAAKLEASANLSDVADKKKARENLEIKSYSLSRENPFGDIKSDGDDAISQALRNLGLIDSSGFSGRLIKVQVFTSTGQVTKTAGAKRWKIRALGGGGGSSAAQATGDGEVSISCGGGAGAYAEGYYDVTSLNSSLKVNVGSGGKAGNDSDIYGGAGGASSVESMIYVPGGMAGLPAGPSKPPFSPVGNTNSNSPTGWNIVGTSGPGSELAFASSLSTIIMSRGANSQFGVGGAPPAVNSPSSAGGGYGSGASGCANSPNKSVNRGEVGRGGIVIIEEYA